MARANAPLVVFNRGRLSAFGLGRMDLDRTRLSAQIQTNWMPRTLGSMMLRPGLEYIGTLRNSSTAILVPFIKSVDDTALLSFTSTALQIWVNDAVLERAPSTAAVTLGNMSSTLLGGWTDIDESGATSEYFGSSSVVAGASDFMSLIGTPFARAGRRQTITSTSTAVVHGLRVTVTRGRVFLKVGSTAGAQDYLAETQLRPGVYSFGIASTANWTIDLQANTEYRSLVQAVAVDSSGALTIDSTWVSSDLHLVRTAQSADVIFAAAFGYRQKRIERHSTDSWAIANYDPLDGPFGIINTGETRLRGSTLRGNIDLEADRSFFLPSHAGALFRLTSQGQDVSVTVSASDQFSNPIRVTGVGDSRLFDIIISGTFVAGLEVHRSIGEIGNWSTVTGLADFSSLSVGTTDHQDNLDNQIIYYRVGSGAYTSGTPIATLSYDRGGLAGVARVETVFAATLSSASVLTDLGSTEYTDLWEEGAWSTLRGFPSAVSFHEGRLWWAGKAKNWGSISNAFESFDPEETGDAGPIVRNIAYGAVDRIQWLGSVGTLMLGAESREIQAKTDSLEQPLTPDNYNLRDVSAQGSAGVQAVTVDNALLFVQKSALRVYEIAYGADSLSYVSRDVSVLVPEIGEPGISRMAVQRQPDTRIHCVRSSTDGTVAMLLSDKAENILAWIDIATGEANGFNGRIEDAAVLPTLGEDSVYYAVRREINGSTVLYLERWASEWDARGGVQPARGRWRITGGSTGAINSVTVDDVELLSRAVPFADRTDTAVAVADEINRAWSLPDAAFDSVRLSADVELSSANMQGHAFSTDGTRLVTLGDQEQTLYQYTLSSAFDLSTATYDSVSFDISPVIPAGRAGAIVLGNDGSNLYISAYDIDADVHGGVGADTVAAVVQYVLSTPYDISTAVFTGTFLDVQAPTTQAEGDVFPFGLHFKPDGTKMYVVDAATGSGDEKVYQYNLGTAWDIASATLKGSFDISSETTFPTALFFKPDGRTMFVLDADSTTGDRVLQYTLSTAWEVSTASLDDGIEIAVGPPAGVAPLEQILVIPQSLTFDPSGRTMHIGMESGASVAIYQYSFSSTGLYKAYTSDDLITIAAKSVGSSNNGQFVEVTSSGDVALDSSSVFLEGGATFFAPNRGGTAENRIADSFAVSCGTATQLVTGLDHLVGSSVVAWGDHRDLGSYTVSSTGTIFVSAPSTTTVVGLGYDGWYKSVKLAYGSQAGTALTQRKRVDHLGLILYRTHAQGLTHGPSTLSSALDTLPIIENGRHISSDRIWSAYDEETIEFPGEWDSDSRIVLKARAPRPATVLGAIIQMESKEKV